MHSFTIVSCLLVGLGGGASGAALQAPTPVITTAPSLEKRQDPDAISLAQLLLTAIPESLRQIAATNVPAVSSILWEEFLDDKKPDWFLDLPFEIQNYLIRQFGPETAWPTVTNPTESGFPTWAASSVSAGSTQASQTSSEGAGSSQTQASGSQSASDSPESSNSAASTDSTATESVHPSSSATSESSASGSDSLNPSGSQVSQPSSSSTADPAPEAANSSGLSRKQKIGIGVGVPIAIFAAAAIAFGCCVLLRRRRRSTNGSVPPSSPGFIPRFAFQEKHADYNAEQRHPLNRSSSSSFGDLQNMTWDDDVIEPTPVHNQPPAPPPMTNHQPIMAPALYHTHSSNRARGKRTSYQSLHAVAEVSEPDDGESPILPRPSPPKSSPLRQSPKRHSPPRSLVPLPALVTSPVKRKPVPLYQDGNNNSAADLASQNLLRQTMPEYSEAANNSHSPKHFGNYTQISSNAPTRNNNPPAPYVSPIEERKPHNPFANPPPSPPQPNPYTNYVEDYGPEFHHTVPKSNNGYIDIENGLYGGHTDLSRYPTSSPKSSRTEWPLRNVVGNGHRRNKSPLWDRVYDG